MNELSRWLKDSQPNKRKPTQEPSIGNQKLYILGNSFSTLNDGGDVPDHQTWYSLVAKELCCEQINYSYTSASIGSIAYDFEKIRDRIHHNDILIIAQGIIDANFFFVDRREIGNIRSLPYYSCLEEEKTAIECYEKYLDNPENNWLLTVNFLHNLNEITQRLNLKTIFLRLRPEDRYDKSITNKRYPELIISEGYLWGISLAEIESKALYDYIATKTSDWMDDFRTNHLTAENHRVLADKLIACINDGAPLDFTSGFHSKNISLNNNKDLRDFLNLNKLTFGE